MALGFVPYLTLALFLGPVAAGLVFTLLPSFGYLPALGETQIGLRIFARLFDQPGLASSVALTLGTGFAASLVSLGLALGFCAAAHGRPIFRSAERLLAPLLATPHAAIALGFAFLIAPSGWLVRLVSPEFTGWTRPPDFASVGDAAGVALVLGLVLKEAPYLLLMAVAAHGQIAATATMATARTLGYSPFAAWLKAILPQLYPQIRLPIYAVLAFSLSAVDVALILGPSNPPPLAVLAVRWANDPLLDLFLPAMAAASLQLLLVAVAIGIWRLGEASVARVARPWLADGTRGRALERVAPVARAALLAVAAINAVCIAAMALWSVAAAWRFPHALPERWSFDNWMRAASRLAEPALTTLSVAAAVTLAALVLVCLCLENESRRQRAAGPSALWALYLPLLVPQISFLLGAQSLLVRLGWDGTWGALVWFHLLFVLPYVFLVLADPWRALDPRYAKLAACLGAAPWRVFFAVRLPLLLRPLLVAAAVGFAVSIGLYLPTVLGGGGRLTSLATEAVSLASGGDRRIVGVYAFLQALLPLLAFGLALAIPAFAFRNRRGLR
ncbi:MAG: ABC transporter permease subunit [Telmatospirillum sp.]|nr:ABC transporter permease subunit [Telmatospirillum sp.]